MSPTPTLLRGPMAVAAQSWPSRCERPGLPRQTLIGSSGVFEGPTLDPPLSLLPAPQLLEYEPRSGEQVPLLLKMKRSKLALNKAIESGDTDLGE